MSAHALPSCVQRGRVCHGELGGAVERRTKQELAKAERSGESRRQAGWPTAKALNLTDGEG